MTIPKQRYSGNDPEGIREGYAQEAETPTPATAEDAGITLGPLAGPDAVIARWFIDTYGQSFAVADKSRRDILTALTAAGFVIRRATSAAEPGMVTISKIAAIRAHSALVYLRVAKDEFQDEIEEAAEHELATVIAAADPAPGEGE
jgi:hypothetical protein